RSVAFRFGSFRGYRDFQAKTEPALRPAQDSLVGARSWAGSNRLAEILFCHGCGEHSRSASPVLAPTHRRTTLAVAGSAGVRAVGLRLHAAMGHSDALLVARCNSFSVGD